MDLDFVSNCRDKVPQFRIKELKDVLGQLGLSKQGKKQDLIDRILSLVSDEQASWGRRSSIGLEGLSKIVDDAFRKLQFPHGTDFAIRSDSGSDFDHVKPNQDMDDSYQINMKVRCPCGDRSSISESMIQNLLMQCEDPQCHVWQHIRCVVIPEKPTDGISPDLPPRFYCEICRVNRADPFLVTIRHPLPPLRLASFGASSDESNAVQRIEKTFNLSGADMEMLQRSEFDLQVWCILLNDKVQFRMHWPQYADLQVNAVQVRTTNRPCTQLLGTNGRDDGPTITACSMEGVNKITLSRCDSRAFCLGVRIVQRRTLQQVLNLIPKEAEGESFEDALARVRRCLGGGATAEDEDSDSDLEVVADSVTVNLRCPMSGSRIRVAGRFKPCAHLACFDLDTFVELNQRSRKWQCPICLKNYQLEDIIIDPYFNRITSLMRNCEEDVTELDVKPDGMWRVKNGTELGNFARWHLPDGDLCASNDLEIEPKPEIKRVKQEGAPEGQTSLILGIKRDRYGNWELSKPEENYVFDKFENYGQNAIPMSSSATGSYKDGEDASVNQDGGGHFDFSLNNGHELDSLSLGFDPTHDVSRIPSATFKDPVVIEISDSEEDNNKIVSPEDGYGAGTSVPTGVPFSINQSEISGRMHEDLLGTSSTPSPVFFDDNVDDLELPPWPLQSGPQTGNGFRLFETETDAPDSIMDAAIDGYDLVPNDVLGNASQVQDHPTTHSDAEMNLSLVDNPLAFGNDDPSLQIFLPSRSAVVPLQSDLTGHAEMGSIGHSDDWISLRLAAGGDKNDAPTNQMTSQHKFAPKGSRMESLANTASLLQNECGNNQSNKPSTNNQRSEDAFFTYPRQQRSVRQRQFLRIHCDSD
ncbi:E3 SUMO-protein ligase SIZ1 plant protein [Dioscorea alata]|uniref:E3 SUMO-protein ligase SIZ1 plant protein n=2 Tax=Dioscorea alata TaxID=55571 RepID=A0ACB7VT71_DIOAL|nr:E3 SUMO-protein ligase SIZ1 plant protein [Dioscorea alata]